MRLHVLDDRQRSTALHPRGVLLLASGVTASLRRPAVAARAVRGVLLRREAAGPVLMAAGSLTIIVLIVLLFIYEGVTGLWLMVFSPVSVTMVSTMLLAGGGAAWGVTRLKVLAALAMLRRHRCAACDYDLARTAPDANGLVTCPECGAAWRLERFAHGPTPAPAVVVVGPLA